MIELRRVKHEPSGFIKLQQRTRRHNIKADGTLVIISNSWTSWRDVPLVTEGTPVVEHEN